MPWTAAQSKSKTHKADTPAKRKRWAATANAVLDRTGDDEMAIKIANAQMDKPMSLADMMTAKAKPRKKSAKK